MSTQQHWESVYGSKEETELSWTQQSPQTSLSLIAEATTSGRVLDVGGGMSRLAECLLGTGYEVAVLDISEEAINRAKKHMGEAAERVQWLVADITSADTFDTFDVWHDRAVFHFLTDRADRARYVANLTRTIPIDGHAVIATFALDGPERCSGLPVCRYDGDSLAAQIGPSFRLMKTIAELHVTPWGKHQSFQYSLFRRI